MTDPETGHHLGTYPPITDADRARYDHLSDPDRWRRWDRNESRLAVVALIVGGLFVAFLWWLA